MGVAWKRVGPDPQRFGTTEVVRGPALLAALDEVREQRRQRALPYLTALQRGQLSHDDLLILATEYDHVAVATANLANQAVRVATPDLVETLSLFAHERDADVNTWRKFALGAGWCHSSAWHYAADPFEETVAYAHSLLARPHEPLLSGLATLYAVTAAEQDDARIQLSALVTHNAIDAAAVVWFRRRANDDGAAPALRRIIAALPGAPDDLSAVGRVRATYDLLDDFYGRLDRDRLERRAVSEARSEHGVSAYRPGTQLAFRASRACICRREPARSANADACCKTDLFRAGGPS
jgi:hypothetical protein